MRDAYTAHLIELKQEVISLFDKVNEVVLEAVRCFNEGDVEGARRVYTLDDAVDDEFYLIESKCVEILALQQPQAHDLRIIFAILGAITDLERIGDYGVNIVKEVILIGEEERYGKYQEITKMKDIINGMLMSAKKAFETEDQSLATRICDEDDLIDELYKDLYNRVLVNIGDNRNMMAQGTRTLFIGRYLERMGDHITNVCENIVYIATGERVELN